jgi:ABC-type Zn2+ transport system substrate-binding protein/surface adhesin
VRLALAVAISRKEAVAIKQALIKMMTQSATAADSETRALAERLARTLQEEP